MKTATRTIALADTARIREALRTAGVRHAVQIDGGNVQMIFMADDARAAADAIANELNR